MIQGPVFAIVTPFDARGEIDFGALDEYLGFLSRHGVQTIVANGTTGEFASLTLPERMQVLERCRGAFAGTIINHVSSSSYRDCWTLLDHGRACADGALLLPPYYYANVDPAGGLRFMRAVLERAARLPTARSSVYLYNFPEHTQFEIRPEMLRVLSEESEHLAGIKDSGGDLDVSLAYKRAAPKLQVFVGGDRCALDALKGGLDGSVTGCGNPLPEFLVSLQAQFTAGDLKAAELTQRAFDEWTTFRERLPVKDLPVTKAALGARIPGFPPHVRPPFVTADQTSIALVRTTLGRILSAT